MAGEGAIMQRITCKVSMALPASRVVKDPACGEDALPGYLRSMIYSLALAPWEAESSRYLALHVPGRAKCYRR